MTSKKRVVTPKKAAAIFESPYKNTLKLNGIDTDLLEDRFWHLKITLKDAYITHGVTGAILISDILDQPTQTRRKKLKANSYKFKPKAEIDLHFSGENEISRTELIQKLNALDIKSESAVGGQLICKAPLVEAIHYFNTQLLDSSSNRDYVTEAQRVKIICQWVNWFFHERYGIESTYKPEQIRKLISPVEKKKST